MLLVEDQPDVREMMANMLARMGLEVSVCVAGLEALDFLRENPGLVNVVITDHNMPKMTGLELVYQAHFDFPDLPFILISGYSQKKLQALMEEHPAIKAILRKPISRPSLARIIGTVMKDSKKQHEAAA